MSAQCRRSSVVGGRADTHNPRSIARNRGSADASASAGTERMATNTGVGRSKFDLATVSSVFCLPQVQS